MIEKSDASVSPFIGVRREVITLFITADLSDWTILEYPPDVFFSAPSKIVDSFVILSAVSSPYKSWIHISYWDTGWKHSDIVTFDWNRITVKLNKILIILSNWSFYSANIDCNLQK